MKNGTPSNPPSPTEVEAITVRLLEIIMAKPKNDPERIAAEMLLATSTLAVTTNLVAFLEQSKKYSELIPSMKEAVQSIVEHMQSRSVSAPKRKK
jgi:hypothetical protein